MNKKEIKNLTALKQISFDLVEEFKIPQVVLLKGGLAVGKTQMVRYMTQALGFEKETARSPTFSMINLYKNKSQEGIYHVDLYRIKQEKELEDIAFWDIFCEPSVVFIEWPQIVEGKLPHLWNKLVIQMEFCQNSNSRILKWKRRF